MIPFLQQTARFLLDEFSDRLKDVCVVLPGRRGGMFLRKYLASATDGPIWAPAIFSIEDFIARLTGLEQTGHTRLVLELFRVHGELEGDQARPFEDFLRWAPQLLSDFNDLDRSLANPAELFTALSETRAISLWNPDGQPLTEFEKNYLRFYQSLYSHYVKLAERLLSKRQAYQGLAFRVAAGLSMEQLENLPWKHLVFAGFNALTGAEAEIIDRFRRLGRATLLWDADRYYFESRDQEAGEFLRTWSNRWPGKEFKWVADDFASGAKTISIVGSPDPLGQTRYCGQVLRTLAAEGAPAEKTAVVLLDHGLLFPLLNSLPEEISALNITAGLPLSQSPLSDLFDTVFRMHLHAGHYRRVAAGRQGTFYYRDVLRVLRHPVMQGMAAARLNDNLFIFQKLTDDIRSGTKMFIGMNDLAPENLGLFRSHLEFLEPVLRDWSQTGNAVQALREITALLGQEGTDPADREYLPAVVSILDQLDEVREAIPAGTELQVLYALFRESVAATSLPFSGDPVNGFQVMGMLETRTLDFDNLIILSCNDDVLPGGKPGASFIPYDIRRSFSLPTYRQKDAVYAYHFYRLLQRASRVWILYGTEPDNLGGGEKSRFIRQIISDLPAWNPEIRIESSVLATPLLKGNPVAPIVVAKSGETLRQLEKMAERGFSATSLNAYRSCPLKFYFAELAGIREPEDVEDTIGPALLGSVVHEALFRLYKPFAGINPGKEMFERMRKASDTAVDSAFEKKFKGSDTASGENLLMVNVAKLMVRKFLSIEEELLVSSSGTGQSWTVEMLEQHVETHMEVPYAGGLLPVRLKGFIDRADRSEGEWRIIDYKTGNVQSKNLRVTEWEALLTDPALGMGFQLMFYALLMTRRFGTGFQCNAGVFPLKRPGDGFMPVAVPLDGSEKGTSKLGHEEANRFGRIVMELLLQVFDTESPFVQTADREICRKCPYINICVR